MNPIIERALDVSSSRSRLAIHFFTNLSHNRVMDACLLDKGHGESIAFTQQLYYWSTSMWELNDKRR